MEKLSTSIQELPLHMAWVRVKYEIIQYATIIRSAAHLILIKANRQEDHAALLAPIETHANRIIHRYVHGSMGEFERILVGDTRAFDEDNRATQSKAVIHSSSQSDEQSLEDLLLHITHQLRETGLWIREYTQRYTALYLPLPSQEQQDVFFSVERALNNYFEVVDVILEDMFLNRIRRTPH